jgi:D-glycero-alpha-D-manno-heptose-7-phosphate kinase
MIITRTPYRVSFFGGGTDYPVWFREHGGAVLATAIDHYCYISCRYLPPFFEHRSRVVYSRIENVSSNRDIQHPAVRGILEYMGVDAGVEIHHDGDLPARTGLGSSSAFTVGMLHGIASLQGRMPTKLELAQQAIHVEQKMLKESVGCQDQVLAAFGGFVRADFNRDGAITVSPIVTSQSRIADLRSHLLLYFTGFSRTASEIAEEQIQRTGRLTSELSAMRQMVDDAQSILCSDRSLDDFGRLLHEAWTIKRSLTPRIATQAIDDIYAAARAAGALGGKLLGAGGGGFMILFAHPEDHSAIRTALTGLLQVPFGFDHDGTQVVVYRPDRRLEAAQAGGAGSAGFQLAADGLRL